MANDVDMSFAKVAYANAGSEEVKAFAKRMLTDHTQIIATMRALASDEVGNRLPDSPGPTLFREPEQVVRPPREIVLFMQYIVQHLFQV